jgi:hypothetical protein
MQILIETQKACGCFSSKTEYEKLTAEGLIVYGGESESEIHRVCYMHGDGKNLSEEEKLTDPRYIEVQKCIENVYKELDEEERIEEERKKEREKWKIYDEDLAKFLDVVNDLEINPVPIHTYWDIV